MIKPFLENNFTDNGEHSHWNLIDSETGELLWTEDEEEEMAKNGRSIKRAYNKDCAVPVAEQPSPKPDKSGFAQS